VPSGFCPELFYRTLVQGKYPFSDFLRFGSRRLQSAYSRLPETRWQNPDPPSRRNPDSDGKEVNQVAEESFCHLSV